MACSGDIEVGTDLEIARVVPRTGVGGAWVRGSLNGHRFDALVFAGNPDRAEWGLRGSGISKLQVRRIADGEVVLDWDRGLVVPAATALAEAIAVFLAAGLAEHVHGR